MQTKSEKLERCILRDQVETNEAFAGPNNGSDFTQQCSKPLNNFWQKFSTRQMTDNTYSHGHMIAKRWGGQGNWDNLMFWNRPTEVAYGLHEDTIDKGLAVKNIQKNTDEWLPADHNMKDIFEYGTVTSKAHYFDTVLVNKAIGDPIVSKVKNFVLNKAKWTSTGINGTVVNDDLLQRIYDQKVETKLENWINGYLNYNKVTEYFSERGELSYSLDEFRAKKYKGNKGNATTSGPTTWTRPAAAPLTATATNYDFAIPSDGDIDVEKIVTNVLGKNGLDFKVQYDS
jgi:hypothetical protein